MTRLEDRDAFDALLKKGTWLVYKHSTTCSVSAFVRSDVQRYAEQSNSPAIFEVLVIEQRDLSDYIAERTKIPHESPQAIVLRDGQVVWHGSHFEVELARLQALELP